MSSVKAVRAGMALRTHFQPDSTVVEVDGVVDACSAGRLSDCVANLDGRTQPLVVDLSRVDFFGGDGFRALAGIDEKCWRIKVRWALVTSEAVDRLLRVVGPDHMFPITATVADAVRRLTVATPAEVTR
jgi:anti-anti-sigma factor